MDISTSANAYAYQGIQNGFNQLDNTSAKLADMNNPSKNESLVDLKQSETQVQSSAKALKTGNDMLGTIIDIMA
ncbi:MULTISPECIES: hypothetical protein [Piscirickettsiaceae]|jgi:hypothetical protein|uniref:Flagellar biosynthesis protein FlgE n=1 Tax=Hydrogenovibrio thermophilus TaxID=265883 RepID=A0A410H3A9_9GAMM|nr:MULTISPECIES: hypothetical protein [Piscirickettsiaceae]AZR82061.1 hypothetical protein AYJ59_07015 [Thiomicrospira sp. S5]QAB15404.1 hypothetical protein EPV75_06885 [Hydrogenovibrio thermophilus]